MFLKLLVSITVAVIVVMCVPLFLALKLVEVDGWHFSSPSVYSLGAGVSESCGPGPALHVRCHDLVAI